MTNITASSESLPEQGKGLVHKTGRAILWTLALWGAFTLFLLVLALAGAHHLAHSIF